MKFYPFVCAALLASPLAGQGQAPADRSTDDAVRPRVLADVEPPDSIVFTLPGTSAKPATPPPALASPKPLEDDDDHRPVLRRAPKPVLPAEFERESAVFTQRMIGSWTEPDAYNLYGDALRERPVSDDNGTPNGRVLAYSDPTGRYREIELDFAKDTGVLRTVIVYPWKMSWQECRRTWGSNVQSTQANRGRIFYSYVNRHLDVLVDRSGNVISLGLY